MIDLIIIEAETDSSRGMVKTLENKGRKTLENTDASEIQQNLHVSSSRSQKVYQHHTYFNLW